MNSYFPANSDNLAVKEFDGQTKRKPSVKLAQNIGQPTKSASNARKTKH